MHRDQRIQDNWAMLYAQKVAIESKSPLHVITMITDTHPKDAAATLRAMQFSLKGLEQISSGLKRLNIAFHLLNCQEEPSPGEEIAKLISKTNIGCLITDFSALRPHRAIIKQILTSKSAKGVTIYQVDAHNIVPVTITSNKQEYAARTIRKKIMGQLREFITEFPRVAPHPYGDVTTSKRQFSGEFKESPEEDWEGLLRSLKVDKTVKPAGNFAPGEKEGLKALDRFISKRISIYEEKRNDPNEDALSGLSPWFHSGQLSVQRAVLEVKKRSSHYSKVFIEEAVVRRELSDNFCYYNEKYDSVEGAADWARKTLEVHRKDKREYLYSRGELEKALTHDPLWNAAQLQLASEGKMHGFMRMYWAKKILEWTESPERALADAIYLNDRYSLDGNDASGYVGCMWSICGVHDRAWKERDIFGKVRYMNFDGCKRKFDVNTFIEKYGPKKQ